MSNCTVPECKRKAHSRGWCRMHYKRWMRHGDPLTVLQKQNLGLSVEQRFWLYVKKTSGCWEWTGYCGTHGYGFLSIDNIPVLTHRLSWEMHNGPIPAGLHVLHRCDNRKCVRPRHLFLGTNSANIADRMAKGRSRNGVSVGEAHGCSKLTEAQAREILASKEVGTVLAKRYGVSRGTISEIRTRKTWRHLAA